MHRSLIALAALLATTPYAFALCAGTFCDPGGNNILEVVPMNCPTGGGPCATPQSGGSSPSTPSYILVVPSANLATPGATVTSTATQITAARVGTAGVGARAALTVTDYGATAIFCGATSGVTAAPGGGFYVGPNGAAQTINYTGALWCITVTGSTTVTAAETF